MHDQQSNFASSRQLEADERVALATLVARLGEIRASAALGVARGTLARAAAGFALTAGNAHLIRARLHELRAGVSDVA